MCKCCQHCLESCYWNLIEEKFCFDENIALYEEPVKRTSEKNNNMFDNMAFYDSVSVIAGRAIVTIDPLEPKRSKQAQSVVVEQPRKRLKWPEKNSKDIDPDYLNKVPFIKDLKEKESTDTDGGESEPQQELLQKRKLIKKSVSFHNIPGKTASSGYETDIKSKSTNLIVPEDEEVTLRVGKSLRERRMSKSLSLKIGDIPKELPIIRQNSMPKFYLDTPDENQLKDSSIVKNCVLVLQSPMPVDCSFDLQSVVQMEKDRQSSKVKTPPVPIHRETSKLNVLKDKIMLKKSKSTISASNLPYTNHM